MLGIPQSSLRRLPNLLIGMGAGFGIGELTTEYLLPVADSELATRYEVDVGVDRLRHFLAVAVVASAMFMIQTPSPETDENHFVMFVLVGLSSSLWPWTLAAKLLLPLFFLVVVLVGAEDVDEESKSKDD